MKTKKICLDARLYLASGIGTFLQAMIRAMATDATFDLTLLCRKQDLPYLVPYGCKLKPVASPVYSISEQTELPLRIPRCDLFWSPHFNVPLLPIRAKRRVATIQDVFHLAHFSSLSLPQKAYAKIFYSAAFALSDCVMAPTEFSKGEILRFAKKKPKQLLVHADPLYFQPTSRREVKEILLCVGNLKPHKNFLRLVQAYAKLRPAQKLYVVGKKEGLLTVDSQLFQEVENHPFLKENVVFTGYIDEAKLKALYASAKLFVFPSLYEGFGYPPLEAMASGCPVVASSIGAVQEVCGDAVEYIDPLSLDSIADGISRLLGDERRCEELTEKGYKQSEKYRGIEGKILETIGHLCMD